MLERHHHVFLLIAAIGVSLAGCDEPPPEDEVPSHFSYAVEVESSGWDTLVYVNGNPVQRLGADGADRRELTIWVREGTNTVRIEATRTRQTDAAKRRCLVRFTRNADADDPRQAEIIGQIDEPSADRDRYEIEFEFECPNDYHWAWQTSDVVDELGQEDRAAIMRLIGNLEQTLRDKDTDAMVALPYPYWNTDSPENDAASDEFGMTILPRELAETVFHYKSYVVIAAQAEQLSFVTGERTVMVCCAPRSDPDAPQLTYYPLVLYAGKSADDLEISDTEPPLAFNHSQLHFIKRGGQWLLLSL